MKFYLVKRFARTMFKTMFKSEDADQNDDVEEVVTGDSD